jgi:hypothetical protein
VVFEEARRRRYHIWSVNRGGSGLHLSPRKHDYTCPDSEDLLPSIHCPDGQTYAYDEAAARVEDQEPEVESIP